MPINDSAGLGVYLIDKSQRAATAIGFRSAGAIESDRGLCGKPTLITSDDDYVKVFGSPSMERHGLAAMEAYMLAQRKVPQVLIRAKKPTMGPGAQPFGVMSFTVDKNEGLKLNTADKANAIVAPAEDSSTVYLYFKGEGTYCSSKVSAANNEKPNIVLRMCKPSTQSAYATVGRCLQLQVFDFEGHDHIDEDTPAELAFNPAVSSVINESGELYLKGYDLQNGSGSTVPGVGKVNITAFVNGRVAALPEFNYSDLKADTVDSEGNTVHHYNGMFDRFIDAILAARKSDGEPVIDKDWTDGVGMVYNPGDGSGIDTLTPGCYYLDARKEDEHGNLSRQMLNCFELSITLTASVTLPVSEKSPSDPEYRRLTRGFYGFPCGNVTITGNSTDGYFAKFSITTQLYLTNRNEYMYLGPQNSYWASYWNAYCKETYILSLSFDDFDANYFTMQADAVLNSSKYIVAKSSDTFDDYTIDYENDPITNKLHYFDADDIESNDIVVQNKSYAYSQALQVLLTDNLTGWRCLATPNLGDVMNPADYVAAITASNQSTFGISNIGRPASVDVFGNLTGRHGNRFIADYCQYAYRTLAGKRTAVTMACLVADLLNSHYNEGIEARPPFGPNYGQIACTALSQQFSGPERSVLATQYKINPVIEDGGFFLWKECTSQITETSLSDIHCIISFLWVKFAIYDAMKSFVAEYNDQSTVNRGLKVLKDLNRYFIDRNYIEEGIPNADKNVIGDKVLRFDYSVRFKGVADFVDVYITAYSQTQTLAVSLAEEG